MRQGLGQPLAPLGSRSRWQDDEDALAYLLTRSWVLSLKFDPWHEATRKRSFATFLYRRIYNYEVVNWYRFRFGDSRYRKKTAVLLSLDHDADGSLSELVELVTYGEEDPADRSIDVGRILGGRDRG
jgi:hypothetical protein